MNPKTAFSALLALASLSVGPLPSADLTIRTIAFGDSTDVSKDGSRILYTDWTTGKIMLRDLEGGTVAPVTAGGYPDYGMYARFSPDGRRVAYSWRVGDGGFDLRIVSASGGEPRVLVPGKGDSYFVQDWSPDGKSILATNLSRIILISVEDGRTETLVEDEDRAVRTWARFAPDGNLIAYGHSSGTHFYSLEDHRKLRGAHDSADDILAGWSPDGRHLLFTRNRESASGLWAAPVGSDGAGEPRCIYDSLGQETPLPVGVTEAGAVVYQVRAWRNDLYVAPYDGAKNTLGEPIKVAKQVTYGSGVSWSPTGDRLAYARGGRTVVIRSYPEGREHELNTGVRRYHARMPSWVDAGRSILIGGRPPVRATAGLVTINIQTGAAAPVVRDSGDTVEWAAGSPSGLIYFLSLQRAAGRGRMVERNLRTDAERTLHEFAPTTQGSRPASHLALSADGRMLAFLQRPDRGAGTHTLELLDVRGGEPRELLAAVPGEVLYQPAWTPDGKAIILGRGSAASPDSILTLWRVDVASGKATRVQGLSFPGRNMGGLSVHPDGRKIAFTSGVIVDEGVGEGAEYRDEVRIVEGVPEWLEQADTR